ncbi:MAG: hypothetical protein IAG13_07175 [Deltaproteobacteria bacterium]|nr:hypothetical protein [Nannocystaceae bacterium]
MHERRALVGAAWRELWPVAALAMGVAIATLPSSLIGRPSIPDLLPVLIVVALYAGVAAGRSTTQTLAFLLARPFRREQILAARFGVAVTALAASWAVAAVPILAHQPGVFVALSLGFLLATMCVAFVCTLVGATATDREPLALGIGVLLLSAAPLGLISSVEELEITTARVIHAHPVGLLAAAAILVVAFGSTVRRAWRSRLPVRDQAFVKRLMLACGVAWVPTQLLCAALAWSAAAPDNAMPMVVIGTGSQGLIVASGSPGSLDNTRGPRLDALSIGGEVALDLRHPGDLLDGATAGTITRAVSAGDRVVMTVGYEDEDEDEDEDEVEDEPNDNYCRVVVLDPGDVRVLDVRCGPVWLSPSGATIAVEHEGGFEVLDAASGESIGVDRSGRKRRMLGWSGEQPVTHGILGDRDIRVGDLEVATASVQQAELSPDGHRLAVVIDSGSRMLAKDDTEPSARIGVLSLSTGAWHHHRVDLFNVRIVDWTGAEHVTVNGYSRARGLTQELQILDATRGDVMVSMSLDEGLPVTHIDGPLHGPWLLTRWGVLEAWSPSGEVLWREHAEGLERDSRDRRRWAVFENEVHAVALGRVWRRSLPWEEQR